ncbi:hypothetical protein [Nodosilinea sp. E11]|nr:hypothetical protein [Nodosilinea sp. E11]WOD39951.1 hypothetical protein RRF56_04010 [Nodosilinea sp. E11]
MLALIMAIAVIINPIYNRLVPEEDSPPIMAIASVRQDYLVGASSRLAQP